MHYARFLFFSIALLTLALANSAQAETSSNKDVRIQRLLDQADLQYEIDSDGDFVFISYIDDDRSQKAFINSKTHSLYGFEIREIWSVGYVFSGELPVALANHLLLENAKVKFGAWRVEQMGDKHVAIYAAHIAADADIALLSLTLRVVLTTADELEHMLTGEDDF